MKRVALLFFVLVFGGAMTGQISNEIDPVSDIYGLEIQLLEIVKEDKCDCCLSGEKSNKCVLFLGRVDTVFFIRDTTVHTIENLQKIKYFAFEAGSNTEGSHIGKSLLTTAENTCSDKIIKINRIFSTPPKLKPIHARFAIAVGLKRCIKRSLWNRVALFLGNKKAQEKYKLIPAENSDFVKAIKE